MYHPIVQIHAGSKVNVVFLKGFFLIEGTSNGVNRTASSSNQDFAGEGVKQAAQDIQPGDPVTVESRK